MRFGASSGSSIRLWKTRPGLREVRSIPRQTPSKFAQLAADEQVALTEACQPGLEHLGYPL